MPSKQIISLLQFIQKQASDGIDLGDFVQYLLTKFTDKYTDQLSWYEFHKTNPTMVDMTSNRVEAHHKSLQVYFGTRFFNKPLV